MEQTDVFAYMIATEKIVALISQIEHTLEFFDEYKIKPDEEVKKVMMPLLEQMKKWVEK